MIKKDIELML